MKKIIICFALVAMLVACRNNESIALKAYITKNVTSNTPKLSLKDYNGEVWDKIYIIPPYVYDKLLDETLIKYKSEIFDTGIGSQDNICVLVLVNSQKLTLITTFKLTYNFNYAAKFANNKYGFYTKNDAVFSIREENGCYMFRHK